MRRIKSLKAIENFQLLCEFEDGITKLFNFKPYLTAPVFKVLENESIFKQVINKNYFVEWQPYEIDLSADTLWHDGVAVS